jgi:hypothetical protein
MGSFFWPNGRKGQAGTRFAKHHDNREDDAKGNYDGEPARQDDVKAREHGSCQGKAQQQAVCCPTAEAQGAACCQEGQGQEASRRTERRQKKVESAHTSGT